MDAGQLMLGVPLVFIGVIMIVFLAIVLIFGLFAMGITGFSFLGSILGKFGIKISNFRAGLYKYAINSLKERLTRSLLTIISITIGIMAVFALWSFGEGLQKYVSDVAAESGVDKLMIQPRGAGPPGSTGTFISDEDVDFLRKLNGLEEVSPMYMNYVEITNNKDKKGKWVFGAGLTTDPKEKRMVDQVFTVKTGVGRDLKKGDSGKVVLGYNYQIQNKMFEKPIKLRDKVYINDKKFEVVGFYEEVGNPSDDANVYFTFDEAENVFATENEFQYAIARVSPGENATIVAQYVKRQLRKFKDQEEGQEDFFIQTFEQAIAAFSSVLNVLRGILLLIIMISIVVAAVNIINTMYTAVLERTQEIGIMKSIGSSNMNIMFVFIVEAGLQGLIGGVLGVFVGFVIAKLGGAMAAAAGYSSLQPYFPWWLIVFCLGFAYLIGAGAGFFPAWQASKLKPVDALRYE